MTMVKTGLVGVVLVAAVAAVGCGGAPQYAPEPQPVMPMAPPPPPAQPVAPVSGPCEQVQSLALSSTILSRAPSEAPGMKPEGAQICGVVPEGQTLSGPTFQMEQGFCYTVIGQAQAPGVSELDMEVRIDLANGMTLPPMFAAFASQPLMQDVEQGDRSLMPSRSSCYEWPLPVPGQVKVILKATRGSGSVAAQVYKKKKKSF